LFVFIYHDAEPVINHETKPVINHEAEPVINHENDHSRCRRSYSIKEKRELVQTVGSLVAAGASLHQACAMIGLTHNGLDDLEQSNLFFHFKTNGAAQQIHCSLAIKTGKQN
jgi:hypothetical protein